MTWLFVGGRASADSIANPTSGASSARQFASAGVREWHSREVPEAQPVSRRGTNMDHKRIEDEDSEGQGLRPPGVANTDDVEGQGLRPPGVANTDDAEGQGLRPPGVANTDDAEGQGRKPFGANDSEDDASGNGQVRSQNHADLKDEDDTEGQAKR